MPPILALTLCTVFACWLLTLDRKSAPNCSFALWLPTIWVLLIASKPLGVWLLQYRSEGETGSPFDRYFITAILIIGIIVLVKRRFSFSQAIKENFWLVLLMSFMLISTIWSSMFFTSLIRWIRETPALIMPFIILSESNPREAMLSVIRRTTYILIPFSMLLIKYFPEYGIIWGRWSGELIWVGVTTQKNGLGRLCLISGFFLIWSIIKRWRAPNGPKVKYQTLAEIFLLIITVHLLKGPNITSMSVTAVTSLSVGLIIFIGLLFMKKIKVNLNANIFMVIIASCIIFGIITVFTSGSNVASITSSMGRESTLTGRTVVWQSLVPVAMQHPLLGHGSGGFWTAATREYFEISEAHSGYLDVILELGFAGLILVSLFLLSSCHRAQKEMKSDYYWAILWICFLIMSAVHNISESSINGLSTHLTAILVFLAIASTPVSPDRDKLLIKTPLPSEQTTYTPQD